MTHVILFAAEGLWHLGSLFYHGTQYSQRGWYITNLLLCDILRNNAPRTGPHHIWRTVPFLWPREEHGRHGNWADFCWPLFVMATSAVHLLPLPQNSLLTSLAITPDSEAMAEFPWMLPPQVLFIFFRPLLDTHNCLPCLEYYIRHGTVAET